MDKFYSQYFVLNFLLNFVLNFLLNLKICIVFSQVTIQKHLSSLPAAAHPLLLLEACRDSQDFVSRQVTLTLTLTFTLALALTLHSPSHSPLHSPSPSPSPSPRLFPKCGIFGSKGGCFAYCPKISQTLHFAKFSQKMG